MALGCKILCRLFTTSQSSAQNVFNHVTVIGGGLMGSGIAQVTAQAGMNVTVLEVNEEAVKKSDTNIKTNIQKVAKKLFQNQSSEAEKYISESMGRLSFSMDLNSTVSDTDLVVEAIVENIEAKHKLFSRIDLLAPDHTIFASNTSSLSIREIAAVTNRKDRFGGLHFFNPVPVMKLLEVIRTEETSEDTYQKMLAWAKSIGKIPVTCKDTPGFVVNRLLVPYLAEAARMLERGEASAKDIDNAMKLGAGYPMGPLELLDYVGLDTTKFILDGWSKKFPNNPLFVPIPILDKLVSEGKLGKKSGEGFYTYKKIEPTPYAVHSPYFLPFFESPVVKPTAPAKVTNEVLENKPKRAERKNVRVVEVPEPEPEPESGLSQVKLDRLEKLRKLDLEYRIAERKCNNEDVPKMEPVRTFTEQSLPSVDFLSYRTPKPERRVSNVHDFIKFERGSEDNFPDFRFTRRRRKTSSKNQYSK